MRVPVSSFGFPINSQVPDMRGVQGENQILDGSGG